MINFSSLGNLHASIVCIRQDSAGFTPMAQQLCGIAVTDVLSEASVQRGHFDVAGRRKDGKQRSI